jgi:putative sigma-54 modulation protein
MDINIRSRNGARISERQRSHIEEKLAKLQRYAEGIREMSVEVSEEQHRKEGEIHRVQVTLMTDRGTILRAEKSAVELYAAVDLVEENLHRQITRYKDRTWKRGKGVRDVELPLDNGATPVDAEEEQPAIIRTKNFDLKPMHSDEAVEQMELLGHDFFVYRDAETSVVHVLYRRRDGNYGMIVTGT